MRGTTVIFAISAFWFATRLATAYPVYWYDSFDQVGRFLSGSDQCDGHPTEQVVVVGLDSPHPGAPSTDNSITFLFRDLQSGSVSTTFCPGKAYNITLAFLSRSLALLSANTSNVAFTSPMPTSGCPNRVDLGRSSSIRAASTFSAAFNVPCSLAGQAVLFKVTAAPAVKPSPWTQNTVNMAVSQGASCGTCVPPSPPPSSSPPPPPSPLSSPPPSPHPQSPAPPPPPPPPDPLPPSPSPPLPSPPPSPAPPLLPPIATWSPPPPPAPSSPPPPSPPPSSPPPSSPPPPPPSSPPPPPPTICTPSNLGYQCMKQVEKVIVHWSLNTTSAPAANRCTPRNLTAVNANDLVQYGTLHMAVQANVSGYVGLGFGEEIDEMAPADIVFGWAAAADSAAFIGTFYTNSSEYLGMNVTYPPPGEGSWAYDTGVTQESSTTRDTTTTICFSRRLTDARAPTSPAISTDSPTVILWAVGPFRNFTAHQYDNVGGFQLTLNPSMVTAVPPPPLLPSLPPPPSPSPPPLPSNAPLRPPSPAPPPPAPPPPRAAGCNPSPLGYQCMTSRGRVTVHWSVNTTSAPAANGCTPNRTTAIDATTITRNGTLHMAVQANVSGYVGIGFLGEYSGSFEMFPSDIVFGFVNSAGSPYIKTFHVEDEDLGDEDANASGLVWAYDMGVSERPSNGVITTTICFSRLLEDTRASSSRVLRTDGPSTPLIWAVSNADSFQEHTALNRNGFLLDLGLKTDRSDSESKTEEQEEDSKLEEEENRQLSPSPAAPSCESSSLGYDCSKTIAKVTLHWSVNTPISPRNNCTGTSRTNVTDEDLAKYGTLHIAVQSKVTGYVSIGFNSDPGAMFPSDIALGWVSTQPVFNTYHVTGENLDARDAVSPTWAYDSGVVRDTAAGVTTICFSRRLVDSRAKASPNLMDVIGSISTGSSGGSTNSSTNSNSSTSSGRRRLLAGSGQLGLIWAVSPRASLTQHTSDNVGGFFLDVSGEGGGGGADEVESDGGEYWINVHGALMAVAWGLLLPLGTLLPAHRWLLGDVKLAGKHLWFWLHLACQWTGMGLFIAGFVIAFVKFGEMDEGLPEAHEKIGIAVMAAAGAQVVFAYIRPEPGSKIRGPWNLLHHNLGRLTILLAWANVYIGIVVYHVNDGASYIPWITPIAIVMGLLVIATLVLRLVGPSSSSTGQSSGKGTQNAIDPTSPYAVTAGDKPTGPLAA